MAPTVEYETVRGESNAARIACSSEARQHRLARFSLATLRDSYSGTCPNTGRARPSSNRPARVGGAVASRLDLETAGAVQQGDRADGRDAGAVGDLPAARFGVADRQRGRHLADHAKQARADIHRDVVFLALEAVGAGDAAADLAALDDLESRYEAQELDRGGADAMPPELTGRVVEVATMK